MRTQVSRLGRWPRASKPANPMADVGVLVLLVALSLSGVPARGNAAPAPCGQETEVLAIWPGPPAGASETQSLGGRVEALEQAVHLSAQGDEYVAARAYAAAEPLYREALAIFEAALGPDAIHILGPLHNVARLYRSWGRLVQAEFAYHREACLFEKELGPNNLPLGLVLADMADIADVRGHDDEAEQLYRQALAMVEGALGVDSPRSATILEHYQALLAKLNRTIDVEAPPGGSWNDRGRF